MTARANDRWLLPFLAALRPRPAIRTGDNRVESLENYMDGYKQARRDCGFVGIHVEDKAVLRGFKVWLAARANEELGSHGWCWLVKQVDAGEQSALTFFRLFEEYLQSTGQSLDDVEPWQFEGTVVMSHD